MNMRFVAISRWLLFNQEKKGKNQSIQVHFSFPLRFLMQFEHATCNWAQITPSLPEKWCCFPLGIVYSNYMVETNRFNEAWHRPVNHTQPVTLGIARWRTEESVISHFEVNFWKIWVSFCTYSNFKISNIRSSTERSVLELFQRRESCNICCNVLSNCVFYWNISTGYFQPFSSLSVLLPIEYLWLRLLANVPGLWKMQTIGKTGWKTPKELLHESAALSYQKHKQGIIQKANSSCKAYTWIYPLLRLMFALQVNCY